MENDTKQIKQSLEENHESNLTGDDLLENEFDQIWSWFEKNHEFNLTDDDLFEILLNTVIENHSSKKNKFKESFLDELIINLHEHQQALKIRESFQKLLQIINQYSLEESRKTLIELQNQLTCKNNQKLSSQDLRSVIANLIPFNKNESILHYECNAGELLFEISGGSKTDGLELKLAGYNSSKDMNKISEFSFGENIITEIVPNKSYDKYDHVIITGHNSKKKIVNNILQFCERESEVNENFSVFDKIFRAIEFCKDGKIIAVLESSVLISDKSKMAIKQILDSGLLEAVVSLPFYHYESKIENQRAELTLLIMSKNKHGEKLFASNRGMKSIEDKFIEIFKALFRSKKNKNDLIFLDSSKLIDFDNIKWNKILLKSPTEDIFLRIILSTIFKNIKNEVFNYKMSLLANKIKWSFHFGIADVKRVVFKSNKKCADQSSLIWRLWFGDIAQDYSVYEKELDKMVVSSHFLKVPILIDFINLFLNFKFQATNISRLVSKDEILSKDCLLQPELYTDAYAQEISKKLIKGELKELGKFGEVPKKNNCKISEGMHLKIKNLSSTVDHVYLVVEQVDIFDKALSNYRNLNSCVLKEGDIIVSLANKYLRPTIFNHKEECEFLLNDDDKILIFRTNSKVNSEYIFYQLHSSAIQKQLDLFYEVTGKSSIKENYFLDLKVPEIPLKEKEDFLAKQKAEILKFAYSKEEDKKRIQEIKIKADEELFQSLQFLSHDLNPKFQTIKTNIKIIEKVIEQHGLLNNLSQEPLNATDKVKTNNELLTNSVKTIEHIVNLLKEVSKKTIISSNETNFEWWNIKKLFIDDVMPTLPTQIDFHFNCNEGEIALKINQPLFKELFDNLFRNAIIHGLAPNKEKIKVTISLIDDANNIIIDYANDGNRFPENIHEKEFLTFGNKNKNSPGDGIGGALISKVLKIHNASFKIIRDKSNPVHFIFTFPKGASNEY